MQLRKKLHTPYWRDPRQAPERGLKKSLMALVSLVSVLTLFIPPAHGYNEPLSEQFAQHEVAAWACFLFMAGALVYFAVRIWDREHYLASFVCGAMCLCLAALAATDPFSSQHLGYFSVLVLLLGFLHWGLWWTHENAKVFALAILATGAVALCFRWLGYGERLLILASTASINVVFYEHISY